MPERALSVVVAAWPDTAGLEQCLAALAPQRDGSTEVIVASSAPAEPFAQRFPWLQWVDAPADGLIPHLWSRGIAAANGHVVALTTAHFTPGDHWIAEIRAGHGRLASAAIGGAIDPPRDGTLVEWATYFLRYSAYLGYDREQTVPDLAGDNASYKRSVVASHPEFLAHGFWEQEFHARLRKEGGSLAFLPAMRVRLHASFGFAPFLRQRFRHGRAFGQARLRGHGASWRGAALFGSPLIPAILLGRVTLRVLRSRRDGGHFLASLPILFAFVLAWAAGEATGYAAPGTHAPGAPMPGA